MNELLKKLLEADVLTEETRTELETAFQQQINETMQRAREEATVEVTARLEEQWIQEREVLIEALDAKVSDLLADELKELREDIERFRDLEAEYAERLVEEKANMAIQLKADMDTLIENLDRFVEVRLTAEIDELREDVETVKRNEFGRNIFEAFVAEYKKFYTDDDTTVAQLSEAEKRLGDTMTALEEAEKKLARMERTQKMDQVLKPLDGRTREVMEAILKHVDTSMLEEAYKTYIGRVLRETADTTISSEKETEVLAEGKKTTTPVKGVVKSGDDSSKLDESVNLDTEHKPVISAEERSRLRRLAGIA